MGYIGIVNNIPKALFYLLKGNYKAEFQELDTKAPLPRHYGFLFETIKYRDLYQVRLSMATPMVLRVSDLGFRASV